jgi:pyridoxine 4-dehydrogenase
VKHVFILLKGKICLIAMLILPRVRERRKKKLTPNIVVERYFAKYPEDANKVVLSVKGGYGASGIDGSPENIRRSIDNCINLLKGRKKIDIFECARRDVNTPLEVTYGVMDKEYLQTGKIGGIGISEVKASTLQEAAKITKIAAVEIEFSL